MSLSTTVISGAASEHGRIPRVSFLAALLACCFILAMSAAQATNIIVNSNADAGANDGACTLREAINAANNNAASGALPGECAAGAATGQDVIGFGIPGQGPHHIMVGPVLPAIVSSVVIDGYTQPDASPNTQNALSGYDAVFQIVLDGSQSDPVSKPGLTLQGAGASNSVIRGLEIAGFTSPTCCADSGLFIRSAAENIVIAGNAIHDNRSRGVHLDGFGTALRNVRVGGPLPGDRNLIYGNNSAGVTIANCDDCIVENNVVGVRTDAVPIAASGNHRGIEVLHSPRARLSDNWIAGNSQEGVEIVGSSTDIVVDHNLIGGGFQNQLGIAMFEQHDVFPDRGLVDANVITGNRVAGVVLSDFNGGGALTNVVLRRNRIYDNYNAVGAGSTSLEIDLALSSLGDGITANDLGDMDSGPNGLQNFPILGASTQNGATLTIPYTLASPAGDYAIEFSFATECSESGHGLRGSMTTDPVRLEAQPIAGNAVVLMPSVPVTGFVSATATGAEGTSEFSACVPYSYNSKIFGDGFE